MEAAARVATSVKQNAVHAPSLKETYRRRGRQPGHCDLNRHCPNAPCTLRCVVLRSHLSLKRCSLRPVAVPASVRRFLPQLPAVNAFHAARGHARGRLTPTAGCCCQNARPAVSGLRVEAGATRLRQRASVCPRACSAPACAVCTATLATQRHWLPRTRALRWQTRPRALRGPWQRG